MHGGPQIFVLSLLKDRKLLSKFSRALLMNLSLFFLQFFRPPDFADKMI